MDVESLYVMIGLLVSGLCGTVYFLQSYIRTKKRELKEREERNRIVERKMRAHKSVQKFIKKSHLTNPITLTNGITVSFIKKYNFISIYEESVRFGVEYKVNGKLYYDVLSRNGMLVDICIDDKYSLEDLEGYDWIIETAYNLTEDRINKIKEEKIKEELFVESVNNNNVVAKNNQ